MYFRLFLRWFWLRILLGFKKKNMFYHHLGKYAWKIFPNTKQANLSVSNSFFGTRGMFVIELLHQNLKSVSFRFSEMG